MSEEKDRAVAGAFMAGASMADIARERHANVREIEWMIRRAMMKLARTTESWQRAAPVAPVADEGDRGRKTGVPKTPASKEVER